ncbi:RNA helicase [Plasmodium vivax Mauritania I]|uniref:RNA helicase n=1 Tax=Plasmodium vivax Mauritania I TaxID=1035515 RepID=A0A0J9W1X4_PLAVI|nr:RNA helicase [Plasmodium vivax Mauritania I]
MNVSSSDNANGIVANTQGEDVYPYGHLYSSGGVESYWGSAGSPDFVAFTGSSNFVVSQTDEAAPVGGSQSNNTATTQMGKISGEHMGDPNGDALASQNSHLNYAAIVNSMNGNYSPYGDAAHNFNYQSEEEFVHEGRANHVDDYNEVHPEMKSPPVEATQKRKTYAEGMDMYGPTSKMRKGVNCSYPVEETHHGEKNNLYRNNSQWKAREGGPLYHRESSGLYKGAFKKWEGNQHDSRERKEAGEGEDERHNMVDRKRFVSKWDNNDEGDNNQHGAPRGEKTYYDDFRGNYLGRGGSNQYGRGRPSQFSRGRASQYGRGRPTQYGRGRPSHVERGGRSSHYDAGGRSTHYEHGRASQQDYDESSQRHPERPNRYGHSGPNRSDHHGYDQHSQYDRGRPSQYDRGRPSQYDRGRPSQYDRGRPSQYDRGRPSQYGHDRPDQYSRDGPPQHGSNRSTQDDHDRFGKYNGDQPNHYGHSGPSQYNPNRSNQYDRDGATQHERGRTDQYERGQSNQYDRGQTNQYDRGQSNQYNPNKPTHYDRGQSNQYDRDQSSQQDRAQSNQYNRCQYDRGQPNQQERGQRNEAGGNREAYRGKKFKCNIFDEECYIIECKSYGSEEMELPGPLSSMEDLSTICGDNLYRNICEKGYSQMTIVQKYSIPIIKNKMNLIASSQTGSGKTFSFLCPVVTNLMRDNDTLRPHFPGAYACVSPLGLVLCPTRELVLQILNEVTMANYEGVNSLTKNMGLVCMAFYGGETMKDQIVQINERQADVIVSTPGRLLDLMNSCKVSLSFVKYLIFDEADEMISLGLKEQMDAILFEKDLCANDARQTILFTATFSESLREDIEKFMATPYVFLNITQKREVRNSIRQIVKYVPAKCKQDELLKDLTTLQGQAIIFVELRSSINYIFSALKSNGYDVNYLHGKMNQVSYGPSGLPLRWVVGGDDGVVGGDDDVVGGDDDVVGGDDDVVGGDDDVVTNGERLNARARRQAVFQQFRDKEFQILIATSIAARGLDFPDLELVINYDLPAEFEQYMHRIGRTGRIGKTGLAINYFNSSNRKIIDKLIDHLKKHDQTVPQWLLNFS